jgi:hypothetical protein
MSLSERELQHAIRVALGRHPSVRLFRNNVGQADFIDRNGRRQRVAYGLCKGSSDLIGFRTLDLPSGPIAQFVAVELKTDHGKLTPEQAMFLELVRQRGGLAAVCRSVEDAVNLFERGLFDR